MERRLGCGTMLIFIDHNVVPHTICREEPDHRLGLHMLVADDLMQHLPGIVQQDLCLVPDYRVFQNGRVLASELPGNKKGCPVDVVLKRFQRDIVERNKPQCVGYRRRPLAPVDRRSIVSCL